MDHAILQPPCMAEPISRKGEAEGASSRIQYFGEVQQALNWGTLVCFRRARAMCI